MADVTYEIDSDGVAVVTWDLENRSMNVLNFQSLGEYRSIIEKLISDESVKGIVLRSAKDAFIAGADLTSSEVFGFDSVQEDKVKAAEKIYNGNMDMQLLFRSMETSGKPFVIYPSGKAKKIGFLRNPKVFPGSEIFVPFEEKTPFLDRLGQGINQSLDRIVQMSTLATATITTIYLVKNINN